jgi:hypothetical protein
MPMHGAAIDQILLKGVIRQSDRLVSVTNQGFPRRKKVRLHALDDAAMELGEHAAHRWILPANDRYAERRMVNKSRRHQRHYSSAQ